MRERTAPGSPAPAPAVPLSAAQHALWAASAGQPDSPAHHLTADVRLPPEADEPAVRAALAALAARHGALRTAVPLRDGTPVQQVHPRLPLHLRVVELGMIPERDRPGLVERLADHTAHRPFDLATGPLWRALLLRTPTRSHVHLVAHQLVLDDRSAALLRAELLETVTAALAGRPARLPELPPRCADPAGREPPAQEAARPGPAAADLRGARREFALPGLAAEVRRAARRARTTPELVLLAGFAALLHRWGGGTDLLIGVPADERPPELRGLIGCFTTTRPLRVRIPADGPVLHLLEAVRAAAAGPPADAPPVRVAFAPTPPTGPGLPHRRQPGSHHRDAATRFDLALALAERGNGYHGHLTYRTARFDPPTVDRMVQHWQHLLPALLADPTRPLRDLPAPPGPP
ncbi:condensation domain-containing protein [Kitasatospora phosalacinea]|uniref:condensation domain-containing protein n=1 Tax=Kitasatospora phosalacinea TaxID=2065 RepID=UPI0035D5967F